MRVHRSPPLTSINLQLTPIRINHLNCPLKHPFTTNKFQAIITTSSSTIITPSSPTSTILPSTFTPSTPTNHYSSWMVIMDKPPPHIILSKSKLINYYVTTLHQALCSDEKDAQRCIYDASSDQTHFGFCCFIDQQTSHVLAGMPGVVSVKPDPDVNLSSKDYSYNFSLEDNKPTTMLFPKGSKQWLVSVENPSNGLFSKAQMVNFYVDILTKVLGNEKDAQMCLYHASTQSHYGFHCILDDTCAQQLNAVPRVLSVKPDDNFHSQDKTYGGGRLSSDALSSAGTDTSKTKLFITGLSFYTSEKTLRAAFEPFGELVEVKIIMDKISKRSKGYAFVEYGTEDAATAALLEMNGKIINGWMIVVDRTRSKARIRKGP